MQDPIVRHSYVQINSSLVHLAQYGFGESILHSSSTSNNQDSSLISCSTLTASTTASTSSSSLASSSTSSLRTKSRSTQHVDTGIRHNIKSSPKQSRKVIIFVPGNPGVVGIYHDFLVILSRMLASHSSNKQVNENDRPTILAIGHNNFDHPDHVQYKVEERICFDDNDLNFAERALAANYLEDPHHIELQVLNKLIILKRLLKFDDYDYKLVFAGHSIGCYVILRLLQDKTISACHEGSVLIHPALENLVLTQGGHKFNRLFGYKLDLIARSVALVLDKLLPKPAKLALTKWYCSSNYVQSSSEVALEAVTQLVCQKTLIALIQMAKSELAFVKDLSPETFVKPHIAKLKLIYAINDHWVNTENRRLLRELYPDLYMEEQAKMHAFVMDPQTVMDYAVKVGLFIQDFIDNIDKKN